MAFTFETESQNDEARRIKSTKTVEVSETFTITDLKNQMVNLDRQIDNCNKQKADIQKKIDDAALALNITVA